MTAEQTKTIGRLKLMGYSPMIIKESRWNVEVMTPGKWVEEIHLDINPTGTFYVTPEND